ncbi:hypothetical protein Fmac_010360 [Flemingia macrophylla]|uniref:SRP54-type proteins GTP-binding domain-containing protein n=1 Tax=Flemingia macrophylla TaxID=520843 RepID=A0ABD1MJH6_9FABA
MGEVELKLSTHQSVSVADELGIPIKLVSVGEGVEDLQLFDTEASVNVIFM